MKFFQELEESININRLQGTTAEAVKNAFFANYFAMLIFQRLGDLEGLRLINDRGHANLSRFGNSMSDLNFWGRALFYPTAADVKPRLRDDSAASLGVEAGRILEPRIKYMMHVPLTPPERLDWNEVTGSLILMRERFSMTSSYFRNLLYYIHNWGRGANDIRRAISQSFMYLLQSDPKSALLPRMRELNSTTISGMLAGVASKIVNFKRIFEDEAGTAVGNMATGDSGGNAIISPPSMGAGNSTPCDTSKIDLGGLYRLKKMSPNQVTKRGKFIFKNGKIIRKKSKRFKPRHFRRTDAQPLGKL